MTDKKCFNCNVSENDKPILNMQCMGKEIFICPQCLPSLIHKPEVIHETLLKAVK